MYRVIINGHTTIKEETSWNLMTHLIEVPRVKISLAFPLQVSDL